MSVAKALAEKGACVVVIIHDLNLAAAYSDRIALMRAGRLVACAQTQDVLDEDLLSDVFECRLRVIGDGCNWLIVPERGGIAGRLEYAEEAPGGPCWA